MTIIEGITAATQAIGLLKELRDIDRSVDEAGYKLKLAEISSALADAKIALSDANLALNEKVNEIANLKTSLSEATSGENCPKCRLGRMQLSGTKGHHMYGLHNLGVEDWTYICDNPKCAFEHTKIHDPHGAVLAQARKK